MESVNPQKSRIHRTEQEILTLIEQFEASEGVTVKELCEMNEISNPTFYNWQKQYRNRNTVTKDKRSLKSPGGALERFEEVFQARTGSAESDEADVISLPIKEYEDKHYLLDAPNPLEAIKYRMEQHGLSNRDLAGILGYKSWGTDLFNRHRKLSLGMVRKLHDQLHIPLETLVKEYYIIHEPPAL